MNRFAVLALAWLLLALPSLTSHAAGAIGPVALKARHAALAPKLAGNAFGGALVLESQEVARRIDGEVFAVLEHPFERVSAALSEPGRWCDILILHLNTKACRWAADTGRLAVRVGKKTPQAPDAASLLSFRWQAPVVREDYMAVHMDADEGPYDTSNYELLAEAVPLPGGRTFLHMGYAFSYGAASNIAISIYLGTTGRDKVGFTRLRPPSGNDEGYVGGMRGVAERNTMRYYLAIDAYLASLSAPPAQQVEQRMAAWFDGTERHARQLREVDRNAYLQMKRAEIQRQAQR